MGPEDERETEEMRGDSDDTAFAMCAVAAMGIWAMAFMISAVVGNWFWSGFFLGMPVSLGLLFLSLYKEWWPPGLRVRDFFKVL
jgi:hypothetical protein